MPLWALPDPGHALPSTASAERAEGGMGLLSQQAQPPETPVRQGSRPNGCCTPASSSNSHLPVPNLLSIRHPQAGENGLIGGGGVEG